MPLHPMMVHLPLGLALILPVIILTFMILIRLKKISDSMWIMIMSLQAFLVAIGHLTIATGENEEDLVRTIIDRKIVSMHELDAEMFVGSVVIGLVISVMGYFANKKYQFKSQVAVLAISIITILLAVNVGRSGAALVYKHGAAQVYLEKSLPKDEVNGSH